jgi:Family of unknown function (DUF5719)
VPEETPRRTGRRASLPAGAAAVPPPAEHAGATPAEPFPRSSSDAAAPAAPAIPAASGSQPAPTAALRLPVGDAPGNAHSDEPIGPEPSSPGPTTAEVAPTEPAVAAPSVAEPSIAAPSIAAPRAARLAAKRSREPRPRTGRPADDRRRTGRILLATATVAALGGTVAAASLLPLPRVDAAAVSTSVTPSAEGLRLGCAGPILQLSEAAAGDSAAVTALPAPVRATGASTPVSERPLDAALQGTEARAFAVESVPGDAGAAVLGSAAQSQFGSAGLVGLVASACAAPAGDFWLVGGSTEVGRTTLVNLLNPTDVAAVVDLTLIGEAGPVTPPGASGIGVPAGGQVVVPLSGLAPGVAAPVVGVHSRGGRVVATLQQSIVRGIDAGGVDTFGVTAAPALRQYIPGVREGNSAALLERSAAEGYADLQTVVRLYVPGDEHTEVRIGVVADTPGLAGTSLAFELEPGQVVDVPLESLQDGSYTVTLDADLPILAAVRQSHVAASGLTDFAWLAAAEPLPAGTETWVSITPGPGANLFLHNPGTARVTGTLRPLNGAELPVGVEPGATAVVRVATGETYRLQADGELRAAVSYLGESGIAGYPVLPAAEGAAPVRVYPG